MKFFINHNKAASKYSLCPAVIKEKNGFAKPLVLTDEPQFKLPFVVVKLANPPRKIGGKVQKLELNVIRVYHDNELLRNGNEK